MIGDSKYFDSLRIRRSRRSSSSEGVIPRCSRAGCSRPGEHLAVDVDDLEKRRRRYCAEHAREMSSRYDSFRAFSREEVVSSVGASSSALEALRVLGLEADASPEAIRRRYAALVKRCHPDANGGSRRNERLLHRTMLAYRRLREQRLC